MVVHYPKTEWTNIFAEHEVTVNTVVARFSAGFQISAGFIYISAGGKGISKTITAGSQLSAGGLRPSGKSIKIMFYF